MASSRNLHVWAACALFAAPPAHASDPADLGGFVLGGPLEAAQQHALQMGWRLMPLSDNMPGQWSVDGSGLSLFVCDGTVGSVRQQLEGELEAFAALVFSMQRRLGKPDIQILSLPSGRGGIATIDVRFGTDDGGAMVQLQGMGGKQTLSVNRWIDLDCD